MWNKNWLAIALVIIGMSLALIFVGAAQAQWHPDIDKVKNKTPRRTTVAKTKPKNATPRPAHDRYANQEVGYRKSSGNEVAMESLEKSKGLTRHTKSVVFEPNDEPLWAKSKRTTRSAKTSNPKAAGNVRNLLPYLEQDNIYQHSNAKTSSSKRRARVLK